MIAPWQEAAEQVIAPVEDEIPADDRTPEELADSIAKGRALFYGERANCIKCHGPTGLGDGQQTDFDVWEKEKSDFLTSTSQLADSLARRGQERPSDEDAEQQLENDRRGLAVRQEIAGTFTPLRNAIPRNLRKGIYRGGRRRIDVFDRVHAGIAGTPMPGVGPTSPGGQGTLTEAEIWQIVDYVLSLPYEAPSQPQRALPMNASLNLK